MNSRLFYILICFIFISSCKYRYRENNPYTLSFINLRIFDSLPSASGIAIVKDSAYVIGDDASYIYKMSMETYDYRKIPIPGVQSAQYRIPKDTKHDYESAVIGTINTDIYLLAFGSGTLAPYRDSLLFFNINNEAEIKKVSLAVFYNTILKKAKLDKKDLNIEGATVAGNHLYLFNRSKGLIFQVNWPEFFQYINDASAKETPELYIHTIQLPKQNEIQAGFSGACTLDKSTIIFTASMEDTKNWVDDGEVTGSYIGILDIITPQEIRLNAGLLVQQDNKAVRIKLESLDVVSDSKESIIVEAVEDHDDGRSALHRLSINKK